MSTTTLSSSELARRTTEIFDRDIRPTIRPEDDGKFAAIDVASGDYEIDQDDYTAVARIHTRNANADVWLMRTGFPAACRI